MNIRELRVGNIVNEDEVVWSILFEDRIEVSYDSPKKGNASAYIDIEMVKPVRITGKRLMSLGFTKTDNSFTINRFRLIRDDNDWIIDKGDDFITRVKYIHQLQNLYFALTNKELIHK